MRSAVLKRGVKTTAGFLVTAMVGMSIPLVILLVAPVAVGDGAGWPFEIFVTPAGVVGAGAVWLVVVAGGLWLGIRNPERGFFRGAFLGSFVTVGCAVIMLMAHLLGRLG